MKNFVQTIACFTVAQALPLNTIENGGFDALCEKAESHLWEQINEGIERSGTRLNGKLNQLYDTILDLQNGFGDQARIDIGNGNGDFLTWGIYYQYDGQCAIEDGRFFDAPMESFADILDTREKLIEAIDELYLYRVEQGLDDAPIPFKKLSPIEMCTWHHDYLKALDRFNLQRTSERELIAKTRLLESIASWL